MTALALLEHSRCRAGEQYVHEIVNHAENYVVGRPHTNGVEDFWSLLKRGLHGTYIIVESFHLFRYLDEQIFKIQQLQSH